MYLNSILRCCLWFLPCRIPMGNCHYTSGCELALLSDFVCIEKCLTNASCNMLGQNTFDPARKNMK